MTEPPPRPSVLLAAFARAFLAFAVAATLSTFEELLDGRARSAPWLLRFVQYPLAEAASLTLLVGPTALVEEWARRRRPSGRRDFVAFVVTVAVAVALCRFSGAAFFYVESLRLEWNSPIKALNVFSYLAFRSSPLDEARRAVFTAPFALFVLLRLRGFTTAQQAGVLVLVGVACSSACAPHWDTSSRTRRLVTETVLFWALLPVVATLGEACVDAIVRRLTAAASPTRHPVVGAQPRRSLLPLVIVECGLAVVFAHAWFRDPPTPPPLPAEEQKILDDWAALAKGALTASEADELGARTVSVTPHVRARLGREDQVCVEREVRVLAPLSCHFVASSTVWIDGEEGPWPKVQTIHERVSKRRVALLSPLHVGRHEVAVVTSLTLFVGYRTSWCGSFTSHLPIEVEGGSIRGSVVLVEPPHFDPERALTVEPNARSPRWLMLRAHDPPDLSVAVRSKAQVRDAAGRVIETFALSLDPGGSAGLYISGWGLPSGKHTLEIEVVPDPDLALEESATENEILGVTIHRRVTVQVP